MSGQTIFFGICIGLGATVTMDLLSSAARRMGLVVGAKGQWVGRWYLGILRGRFAHANIAVAAQQRGEKRAAQLGHYAIGIALAVFYLVAAGWLGLSPRSVLIALGYGLATTIFPLFLVYPGLGFGMLGLKGPRELKPVISSVLNHLFYGFGLWWMAQVLPPG